MNTGMLNRGWRYLVDPSRLTPVARKIREVAQQINLAALSSEEIDVLERTASSILLALRQEVARRRGYVEGAWDRTAASPSAERMDYGYEVGARFKGYPWDHLYTLRIPRRPETKRWISEPYQIDSDQIKKLAGLVDQGWDISIRADDALHFPGYTVAVTLRRQPKDHPTAREGHVSRLHPRTL